MAVYQLTSPQGEKYRVTAPEGATQEQVMAYFHQNANGAAPKQEAPGLVDSLKADYAARDKQIQDQVTATAEGKQSEGEMMTQNALSNASKLTDTAGELISRVPVVGPAIGAVTGAVGDAVKSIPLPAASGYDNVGSLLSSDTRLGRNLRAGGQALNLAGTVAGVRGATTAIKAAPEAASKLAGSVTDNPTIASRAAAGEVATATPPTATDIGAIRDQNYDLARHLNEKFEPDQVSNPFVNDINSQMPKPATANGVLSKDQQSLASQLQETADMVKGQPITLTGIDTVDKSLAAKIGEEVNSQGETTPNGRILKQLQSKLRATVANAPTDGTTALNNGRAAAAAKFALNDIDAAELRAQIQGGNANNYQAQYRRLFNDKDGIAGWPQAAKDALQKAATPSLVDKATGGVITHGAAISSAVLGHPLFGLAIEGGKLGADAAKAAFMKSRGAAVKQAIIDHAMGKIKDVNVPAPEYAPQAQLPAPGKATLSNDEVAQMQAQLRGKPKTGGVPLPTPDPSGIVAPIVPKAPASISNIADRLRAYANNEQGSASNEDANKAAVAALKTAGKVAITGHEDPGTKYSSTIPSDSRPGLPGTNYQERVYEGPETGVISHHYDNPKYYSHVRFFDVSGHGGHASYFNIPIGRNVHEIQSDIHGAGQKFKSSEHFNSYDRTSDAVDDVVSSLPAKLRDEIQNDNDLAGPHPAEDAIRDFISTGRSPTLEQLQEASGVSNKTHLRAMKKGIDEAIPRLQELRGEEFTDKDPKWLRNTLTRLVEDTQKEGQPALNVRIANDLRLMRSSGVQKWYEDAVKNTLQKIANEKGLKSEMKNGQFSIHFKKEKK